MGWGVGVDDPPGEQVSLQIWHVTLERPQACVHTGNENALLASALLLVSGVELA